MPEKLRIEKIVQNGLGISRKENFIYFIPFTAPGELVIAECKKVKDYFMCELLEVIERVDIRENPICRHFGICGGCSFQHLRRDAEIKIKKEIVEENLKRIAKIEKKVDDVIFLNRLNYRNKVEYSFINNKPAYYNLKNEKFNIKECFIEEGPIKDFREKSSFDRLEKLILRTDSTGKIIATGVDRNLRRFIIKGKDEKLLFKFSQLEFEISPYSFFQTNTEIAGKMIEKLNEILRLEKDDIVIDGYGGVGTFGISLSKSVKKVFIVEKSEKEVIDAGKNALKNRCDNVIVVNKEMEDSEEIIKKCNKMILDPPREGLSKELINIINKIDLETIVYVSCNPATLSRDLGRLKNYRIYKIIIFNMFPMSFHIETMVLLRNAPGGT